VAYNPQQSLQQDIQEMKTRQDIVKEVAAILKRRGFDLGWCGRFYVIQRNRPWLHPHETCNWIKK